MQTGVETSSYHLAAGKLVDYNDFAVLDDVVDVASHNKVSAQSLVDIVVEFGVFHVGQVVNLKKSFGFFDTALSQTNGFFLFGHQHVVIVFQFFVEFRIKAVKLALFVVGLFKTAAQTFCKPVGGDIHFVTLRSRAADNKRCTRFVDKNTVHLVDNDEVEFSLNELFFSYHHVIAEVVETEFVIRTVGDIAIVRLLLVGVRHL